MVLQVVLRISEKEFSLKQMFDTMLQPLWHMRKNSNKILKNLLLYREVTLMHVLMYEHEKQNSIHIGEGIVYFVFQEVIQVILY